jgi:hypothetical protein
MYNKHIKKSSISLKKLTQLLKRAPKDTDIYIESLADSLIITKDNKPIAFISLNLEILELKKETKIENNTL